MKKILFVIVILFSISIFSQNKESEIICFSIDEFNDEKNVYASGFIAYMDGGDLKSQGLLFNSNVKEKRDKMNKYYSISVIPYGIDKCVEKGSTLNIIFENGEKTVLRSWNDFNCQGRNYFNISIKQYKLLEKSKIKAIKYTNVNLKSYQSITVKENISDEISSYFLNLTTEIDKINNEQLKIKECKKNNVND
jgi:hypothetical protein